MLERSGATVVLEGHRGQPLGSSRDPYSQNGDCPRAIHSHCLPHGDPGFSFSDANPAPSATSTVGVSGSLIWGPGYHWGIVGPFTASHSRAFSQLHMWPCPAKLEKVPGTELKLRGQKGPGLSHVVKSRRDGVGWGQEWGGMSINPEDVRLPLKGPANGREQI